MRKSYSSLSKRRRGEVGATLMDYIVRGWEVIAPGQENELQECLHDVLGSKRKHGVLQDCVRKVYANQEDEEGKVMVLSCRRA